MAISNHERVGKALDLLKAGLAPFVEREFAGRYRDQAAAEARRLLPADDRVNGGRPVSQWDASAVLRLMSDAWNDLFGKTLGRSERSLVQELRDVRNRWAHQEAFSSDDADRALDSMARKFVAWESILAEKDTLNLSPHQVKQAENQLHGADGAVTARLPETYKWLPVPGQNTPQGAVEWHALGLTGQDPLAVRVSKKLKNDELLVTAFAGTRLRMELDRVPL